MEDFNVACIIILPPWQGLGYGRLLIEFSPVLLVPMPLLGLAS